MTYKPEPVDPTMPMELSDGREVKILERIGTYIRVGFKPGQPILKSGAKSGSSVKSGWFYTVSGYWDRNYADRYLTLRNRHDPLEFVYDV